MDVIGGIFIGIFMFVVTILLSQEKFGWALFFIAGALLTLIATGTIISQ